MARTVNGAGSAPVGEEGGMGRCVHRGSITVIRSVPVPLPAPTTPPAERRIRLPVHARGIGAVTTVPGTPLAARGRIGTGPDERRFERSIGRDLDETAVKIGGVSPPG